MVKSTWPGVKPRSWKSMSTNSWLRTGDEVVQLYVRDEVSSVPRPVLKLCGFERVTLKPG